MFNPETVALEAPDPDGDANVDWSNVVFVAGGIGLAFGIVVVLAILVFLFTAVFGWP